MRKTLSAAIAVAMLGLGVSSVMASPTPIAALQDAATVLGVTGNSATLINAGNGDTTSKAAGTYDPGDTDRGAELAGLAHAYQEGVTSVGSKIASVSNIIIGDTNNNWGGIPVGNEAYGLAQAGAVGASATATPFVTAFYASVEAGGTAGVDARAASAVGGSLTNDADINTQGIYNLSYHVLATNLLNTGLKGQWAADLATAVGHLNTTTSDALSQGTDDAINGPQPGTVQTLAISLWALKTAGYAGVTGGTNDASHLLAGLNTQGLHDLLVSELADAGTDFYQRLTDHTTVNTAAGDYISGYTEDLSYGILALQQFNDPTDKLLVASLEASLAAAVGQTGTTGEVPLALNEATAGASSQYAGAAVQALPEPATLSLLGLGGMALLARRRRTA